MGPPGPHPPLALGKGLLIAGSACTHLLLNSFSSLWAVGFCQRDLCFTCHPRGHRKDTRFQSTCCDPLWVMESTHGIGTSCRKTGQNKTDRSTERAPSARMRSVCEITDFHGGNSHWLRHRRQSAQRVVFSTHHVVSTTRVKKHNVFNSRVVPTRRVSVSLS